MNIDQAYEQITLLKTVLKARNVDSGIKTLDQLVRFLVSQQKITEDMKCCGNCDRENLSMGDYNECPYYYTKNNCLNADHGIDRNYNLKSYWTPKS